MDNVLREVADERYRQDAKWGVQNHHPLSWLAILSEEVGEYAMNVCKSEVVPQPEPFARRSLAMAARRELVQVAAVAVAAIECMDRLAGAKEAGRE